MLSTRNKAALEAGECGAHGRAPADSGLRASLAAVARAGAGIALDADRDSRRVLELPGPDILGELRPALERVLAETGFERTTARIAASIASLPPVDEAPSELAELAARGRRG